MTCPRCETNVPEEALYCPYCSLPKPKAGFVAASEEPQESTAATERPLTRPAIATRRRSKQGREHRQPTSVPSRPIVSRSLYRAATPPRKLRVSVLSVAALVALLSVGAYIFVVPLVYSETAEPQAALSALETLRKTQSNEPGITIDTRMMRELEKSRRVGNLVAYQGWSVHPIKGSRNEVLLVFSYQEVGGTNQRAEWLADLSTNTFKSQTELATSISEK